MVDFTQTRNHLYFAQLSNFLLKSHTYHKYLEDGLLLTLGLLIFLTVNQEIKELRVSFLYHIITIIICTDNHNQLYSYELQVTSYDFQACGE